jgi:N-acetylglutamate synthase-like GNAT family acetyltransferase
MSESVFHIQRATLDDLKPLCLLGESQNLPEEEVVRHLTDFQIALGNDGTLLGAIAIEVSGLHGRIHSEVFSDFGLSETIRASIWQRFESICRSRGLVRLWTQETAPFWKQNGFSTPTQNELISLPGCWQQFEKNCLTLRLRDEELLREALEKEFVRIKLEQTDGTDSLGSLKTVKYTAIGISVIVAIVAIVFCILLLRYFPALFHRMHPG